MKPATESLKKSINDINTTLLLLNTSVDSFNKYQAENKETLLSVLQNIQKTLSKSVSPEKLKNELIAARTYFSEYRNK